MFFYSLFLKGEGYLLLVISIHSSFSDFLLVLLEVLIRDKGKRRKKPTKVEVWSMFIFGVGLEKEKEGKSVSSRLSKRVSGVEERKQVDGFCWKND